MISLVEIMANAAAVVAAVVAAPLATLLTSVFSLENCKPSGAKV